MDQPSPAEQALLGRFGMLFETAGLQRVHGMILGWLLICDPPEQSITGLARALGVSKAAISTSARDLSRMRLLQRTHVHGSRQHFYRLHGGGAWAAATRNRWETMLAGKRLGEEAFSLVGDDPDRRERVQEFVDFAGFLEHEFGDGLQARWEEYRRARRAERGLED